MIAEPEFTLGVEEEYLLVNPESRDLVAEPPEELMLACRQRLGDARVSPEFLRAQIEVGTSVCPGIADADRQLRELRRHVIEAAGEYGLGVIAASTHPSAEWHLQKHTPKQRYDALAKDLQAVVRRLVICGMHVHVGVADADLRIDLMNQVSYFLPHILALTTSSPFWRGEETGLMSYRLTVFDALPRTWLPDYMASAGEYDRLVSQMIRAGVLEDGSKIWWDVRPSSRFPTLEMRIADVCTSIDDAVTVAALYQCLLRMLYRLRRNNQRWRIYPQTLIRENRWLAQRFGCDGDLIDLGRGERVAYADLLEELIDMLDEDAGALDCRDAVLHAREILARGTSARRQLAVYHKVLESGVGKDEALQAVVDWLMAETARGTGARPACGG